MITWHPTIPVWHRKKENKYFDTYQNIMNNFARCCGDDDVIFFDNTYASPDDVINAIQSHEKAIIFNIVDPPYTWHYLGELMQGLDTKVLFVGTDAPDISTWFALAWIHCVWPKYTIEELKFNSDGNQLVYLSYNYRPHEHRTRLQSMLKSRDLIDLGHFTLNDINHTRNPGGRETNLGNLDIWRRHFLNVISETVFRIHPELAFSEKTLKPILGLRPFIINGSPRIYDILEQWDIDMFSDVFPIKRMREPITDVNRCMERNINLIGDVIKELATTDLEKFYKSLWPRLKDNQMKMQQLMFDEYQKLCVNDIELKWRSLK